MILFYMTNVHIVLNEREREIIVRRIIEDAGPATETHFSWNQVIQAFLDWKVYAYSLSYICGAICVYSLAMFMPSIIQGMGYTSRLGNSFHLYSNFCRSEC